LASPDTTPSIFRTFIAVRPLRSITLISPLGRRGFCLANSRSGKYESERAATDKPSANRPATPKKKNGYCVMAYRSGKATKQQQDWLRQQRFKPKAREILRSWARAWEYWDRAIRYLKLARFAPDPDVRNRFILIARHYRALAQAEEHSAGRDGINGTIST
jgi:hypothetical protein